MGGGPSRKASNLLPNSLLELLGPCVILTRAPSPAGRLIQLSGHEAFNESVAGGFFGFGEDRR